VVNMLPCSITKKWLRVPQGGLLKVISQADTLNDSYYFTRTTNSEWTNFASLKLKTKFLSHQPPIHSFSWCLFFHNERLNFMNCYSFTFKYSLRTPSHSLLLHNSNRRTNDMTESWATPDWNTCRLKMT
jgi:hypothetical protein